MLMPYVLRGRIYCVRIMEFYITSNIAKSESKVLKFVIFIYSKNI